MYKLYYSPGACSLAVHVALNECNQPVVLEKIDTQAGQQRTPEYLKINPRGQVPVLVDGDQVLREGAAILIHLLDKHQSPLLPKSGRERDAAIEWLMFANATLHPAYSRVFFLKRNGGTDAQFEVAVKIINKFWEEVEQRLSQHEYIAGNEITAADILVTVISGWNKNVPKPVELGPKTQQMIQKIKARPSFQKAIDAEKAEPKAAA